MRRAPQLGQKPRRLQLASLADAQLGELATLIDALQSKPTPTSLALLIPAIIGRMPEAKEQVPVVLNPATVEELQPFVAKGWLTLVSTGAFCSMGAGNRVGNHIEELKRPWGMGSGFIMTVNTWDLDLN